MREAVAEAIEAIESYVGEKRNLRRDLGRLADRSVKNPEFESYGTEASRRAIRRWREAYARPSREPRERSAGAENSDAEWRRLLAPVIQKDARDEDVESAILRVEGYIQRHPRSKARARQEDAPRRVRKDLPRRRVRNEQGEGADPALGGALREGQSSEAGRVRQSEEPAGTCPHSRSRRSSPATMSPP